MHGYHRPMNTDATAGRPYAGADPDERIARRREQLFEAGIELFATRGYQATTLAILSAQSGVAHRYMTAIYPGKEALLRDIYLKITGDVADVVRHAQRSASHAPELMIRAGVRSACHAFLADPRKTRINCIEVVGVSAEFEQLRRKVIREFCQLILRQVYQLVERGVLPQGDYEYGAIGLVGAFHELMTEWVLSEDNRRATPDQLAEQMAQFFWGALLAVTNPLPESGRE